MSAFGIISEIPRVCGGAYFFLLCSCKLRFADLEPIHLDHNRQDIKRGNGHAYLS